MKQSKILLVSGIYPPDIGGPATYIPKLARFLSQKKIEVSVLSLADSSSFVRKESAWQCIFVKRKQLKIIRALEIVWKCIQVTEKGTPIFSNGLYEEISLTKFLGRNLRVAKIVGDPIWERYRNKTGSAISIEKFQEIKIPLRFRFERLLLVWSLNQFEKLTSPSTQLASMIKKWGVRSPVLVIENGTPCKKPTNEKKEFDVVSVSRLVSWKNIDILIQACSNLDAKLAVVGDGPEIHSLKKLARDLSANVEFYSELPPDEVDKVLAKSKIYALISEYEGLSFSLLEAMMREMPVIVSNNQGNMLVVSNNENGLVIPMRNVEETENAIKRFLLDKQFSAKLSQAARQSAVDLYCEEKQLQKMSDYIYE